MRCENQSTEKALLDDANRQQQQLIDQYGLIKSLDLQNKCDELIQQMALKEFKNCLLLNANFANAYSLANRNVILTKGLLNNIRNDDQLAHILAHEHAHLGQNHHQQVQNIVNNPPKFFTKSRIKKFYREIEKQADASADDWLIKHQRDPLQVQHYLLRVKNTTTEKSADHVKLKDRIKNESLPPEKSEAFWEGGSD